MNFDFNSCTVHICSNVLASCDTLIEEPGSMPLGLVVGSGTATVELENPEPGRVEIDPDSLWEKVTKVCTSKGSLFDQHTVVKLLYKFSYANVNSILLIWFCHSVAQINFAASLLFSTFSI